LISSCEQNSKDPCCAEQHRPVREKLKIKLKMHADFNSAVKSKWGIAQW
jgi:hypothetical protein